MSVNTYKIVPNRIPVLRLRDKTGSSQLKDVSIPKKISSSRVVSTDCLSCEYVSDGSTVIKLSELVKKLKDHKEIKLYPLSLSINENVTEHHAAPNNEGFSSVTIHVDVEDNRERLVPRSIVAFTPFTRRSYNFTNDKTKFNLLTKNVLIQLYPISRYKNCIDIRIDEVYEYNLKDDGWFLLIPEREFLQVKKLCIFGKCGDDEYLVYELESDNLLQNQKITVLNYL